MTVRIELFVVMLGEGKSVRYIRKDAITDDNDPDAITADMLNTSVLNRFSNTSSIAVIHSTSWRYDNDRAIILTYLAIIETTDSADFQKEDFKTFQWNKFPKGNETNFTAPRPAVIYEEDVLSHGLRHIAFLIRGENNCAQTYKLSNRTKSFFSSIAPEVAGKII